MTMRQGTNVVPPVFVPTRAPSSFRRGQPKRMPRWLAVTLWSFFTAMWVAFGLLLIVSPEAVEELWDWIGEQPALLQLFIWVAFLPLMVGVGVWLTPWALWIRVVVLAICVAWTTIGFYPRSASERVGDTEKAI